jgi:hypothetical protein
VWLLRTGDHAIRVRPRRASLSPADSLAAVAAGVDDATLRTWLDFDLRYAEREADGTWRVLHATLPWFEGAVLEETDVLEAAANGSTSLAARHWHPLD